MEELEKGDHKGRPYIGVVVLYNIRIEDSETITSLNKSLEKIAETWDLVVYDNSLESSQDSGSIFNYGWFRIHYFHDPTNPGISKAYNFAVQYGKELKKQWILLLDQDTTFPVDAISTYLSSIKENMSVKLFAPLLKIADGRIISPSKYCWKRGFALKSITGGIHSLRNILPINSGMMVELEAFLTAGGYNEKVKLDFSDFQFIEKFKKKFDTVFIVNINAVHRFSDEGTDVLKLNERFGLYCDGARNCERNTVLDWVQYMIVVFVRACSLALRTKNLVFYRTLYDNFIR